MICREVECIGREKFLYFRGQVLWRKRELVANFVNERDRVLGGGVLKRSSVVAGLPQK